MGSETPLELPTINFSQLDLKPGSDSWNSVKSQVRQALEEYGCFKATFEKVPFDVRKAVISCLEELFDLPLQTKVRNSSKKPFHGYVQYHTIPLFESMGIVDAPIPEKAQSFTDIIWPEGNPNFCKTVQSFSEQLSELDQIVRRMILESFDLEKYIDEHFDSTNYLLRVMKYKAPQTPDTELGLSTHTDKNIFTILYGNQVEGLEVQTRAGEWIKVKHSPNSFTVVMGESLYAWLNGRLHAPYHRVMMAGNEARYSLGLFSLPKEGYMVKSPEEMVDEDHPLLYKPFEYFQFLGFFYTEEGLRAQSALKTYCGV